MLRTTLKLWWKTVGTEWWWGVGGLESDGFGEEGGLDGWGGVSVGLLFWSWLQISTHPFLCIILGDLCIFDFMSLPCWGGLLVCWVFFFYFLLLSLSISLSLSCLFSVCVCEEVYMNGGSVSLHLRVCVVGWVCGVCVCVCVCVHVHATKRISFTSSAQVTFLDLGAKANRMLEGAHACAFVVAWAWILVRVCTCRMTQYAWFRFHTFTTTPVSCYVPLWEWKPWPRDLVWLCDLGSENCVTLAVRVRER